MINHTCTTGQVEFLDSLLMMHPWQRAESFSFGVYLNTILEQSTTHTTCPVEFLDSLLMALPWQHADGYGFGVNLNIILERSTTCVQQVRLNSH
jgi:hypothetical protein